MPAPLGPILSHVDLPEAELCAARLDGEVFRVDEWFSPIDLPDRASLRALALASLLPERLIAEQRTAAWILGATNVSPVRHQFCAAAGARARPANPRGLSIREVVIDEVEIIEIAGLRVTSPLRTAFDLTRSGDTFDAADQEMVNRLLMIAEAGVDGLWSLLQARRNLPGKRRTVARLRELAVAHSVDVIDSVDSASGVEKAIEVRGVPHLEHELAQCEAV